MRRRERMMEDLDRDIREHIAMETQDNIERGMSPEEARYAAMRKFGNVTRVKEETREVWGFVWLEQFSQDIRFGLRMLRKSPGFTAIAVLTLALGIGANTAIFSVINAVLLKMLPIQNPQQLVLLDWASHGWPGASVLNGLSGTWHQDKSGQMTSTSFSYPIYEQIRARNQAFSSVAALAGNGSQLNVGYKGQPGRADGELVSGMFFSTLGVEPILGRVLIADDDRIEASPVAVISYGYWQRRFGGDPGVVGRTITVNSIPYTVIGVSPPEFYGVQPGRSVEVWLPLHTQPQVEPRWSPSSPEPGKNTEALPTSLFEARDHWWVLIIGRLRPDASEQQAEAGLEVILQQAIAVDVKPSSKPEAIPHLNVESGSKGLDNSRREFSKPLFILMAVVGMVLLIASINIANLMLARGTTRQKEIAVRLAVGAGRTRLVRQLLTESALLAGLGGAVGLALAFWGTDFLVALMASGRGPLNLNVSPDPRVLGFTAVVSLLAGILFGLSSALRSTRLELTPNLKESAGEQLAVTNAKRGVRLRLRGALVVTQMSLSLVILVGAGLFVRTLRNLQNVNAGFNEQDLLLFGIDPTQAGYKGERLAEFYQELTRRLEALPGVRTVSLSHSTLIGGGGNFQRIRVQGYKPKSGEEVGAAINWIGPKFFETLGIPLVLGRTIADGDAERAPKVVVVNEQFVRQFLDDGQPIGRRFSLGETSGEETEIVGIVRDTKYFDLRQEAPATIYVPWLQQLDLNGAMHFEVRTADDPMKLVSAVRRVAQDMDANLALYDVKSQVAQINESLFQARLFAQLTSFFGALAALLACVGLYGVMAFAVSRRTREIGVRMALGASRAEIVEMILRETFVLLGLGIVIGILAALGAARLISSLLYGIAPNDPYTCVAVCAVLAGVALVACYIPARRAMRVDPMVALRYE